MSKVEEKNKKEEEMHRSKCDGCSTDDCILSRCVTYSKLLEMDAETKKYENIFLVCSKKLKGEELLNEDVSQAYKAIGDDEPLKTIFTSILRTSVIENRVDRYKKINVESLTKFPELIDKTNIEERIIAGYGDSLKKEYYEDVNLIATSLLLTRCSFTKASGEKIVESFDDWLKMGYKDAEGCVYGLLRNLIDEYNKNNKNGNKNPEELGGM